MKKEELKIVFMGTPEFAVGTLQTLVEGGYNVVAVVTQPDKPVGRHGSVLRAPAVKEYALSVGLPVLQPEKMKDPAFVEQLRSYGADLQVVVAFRMLPEVVWAMPRFGTFNVHAALLPQYRGAAPINWAIINGETQTGVTTFFLDQNIDTGRIILQKKFDIPDEADVEYVYDGLMHLGADLAKETVDLIISSNGLVHTTSQEEYIASLNPSTSQPLNLSTSPLGPTGRFQSEAEKEPLNLSTSPLGPTGRFQSEAEKEPLNLSTPDSQLKSAPKIFKETCRIDWGKSAKNVYDFVRGLSPVPTAWTTLVNAIDGTVREVKVFRAAKTGESCSEPVGSVMVRKGRLFVAACDEWLEILELQLAGKKRMQARDFLNGFKNWSDISVA